VLCYRYCCFSISSFVIAQAKTSFVFDRSSRYFFRVVIVTFTRKTTCDTVMWWLLGAFTCETCLVWNRRCELLSLKLGVKVVVSNNLQIKHELFLIILLSNIDKFLLFLLSVMLISLATFNSCVDFSKFLKIFSKYFNIFDRHWKLILLNTMGHVPDTNIFYSILFYLGQSAVSAGAVVLFSCLCGLFVLVSYF